MQRSDIDFLQVGLQGIRAFKTPKSLDHGIIIMVVHFHIKMIHLIKKNSEAFVGPLGKQNAMIQNGLGLFDFV